MPETPTKPDTRPGARTEDPEVAAIVRLTRVLDGLDAGPQARVVAYLTSRYGAQPARDCKHPGFSPAVAVKSQGHD